ncbi:MAG TPA: hypothetical protein VMT01_00010 [Candidatus Acidoferrum sp.]|nr:hypothetical protein [Candidatus Acidoferrum sp.]
MDLADVVGQVDGERLYQHVLRLQGVKRPIDAPEKLNEAADYVHSEFKQCGLVPHNQFFAVPGFDGTFRNVEAVANHEDDEPELLIVAHYDTVENSPWSE